MNANWPAKRKKNSQSFMACKRLFVHILGVITKSSLNVSDSGLCAANRTDFGGKSDCKEEAAGGNTLYYALFILGMVVAGVGTTPMYALGIPYMDENVSPTVSPMYVGIFMASGIAGKLFI